MPPLDPRMQQQVPPDEGMPPDEMPPEQQAPPDAAMPPAVGDQEEGITPASPEEEEERERMVGRAWELIYDDNTFPRIVEMLAGSGGEGGGEGDPAKGLAMATEMVVARVAEAADRAGHQIPPDVLYHGGADILEELAEVSRRGGIKDYSQDQDALERAWLDAIEIFRDRLAKSGELDQASAKTDLDRLIAMDQNGMLEKIMRDLDASDNAGQAGTAGPNAPEGFAPPSFKPRGMGAAMQGQGAM